LLSDDPLVAIGCLRQLAARLAELEMNHPQTAPQRRRRLEAVLAGVQAWLAADARS